MYDMQLGNIRKRNGWGIRLGQPELSCPIAYYEANGKLRNESLFKDSTWYVLNKFIEKLWRIGDIEKIINQI